MSDVFAVFKEGVYRHQCGGIFSSPDDAIKCAMDLAAADSDSYHEYDVVPFTLDLQSKLVERDSVFTTRKSSGAPA